MRRLLLWVLLLATVATTGGTGAPGQYYTIRDERGRELLITGWPVHTGDRFICMDDHEYVITRVRGTIATARSLGALPPVDLPLLQQPGAEPPAPDRPIVIYHTHNHESFVPDDGTHTIRGNGTIMKVGEELSDALEEQGIPTEHITTIHCPADSHAYTRSRRTVVSALREHEPAALLDVHRDAAPARAYRANIEGERAAQVLLVVGRYNPRRRVNTTFARQVKRAVDEQYPGLIKGIFFASGTYNQDLAPRALLLEFGSHLTRRADAKSGARLFAEAAASVLHPAAVEEPTEPPTVARPGEEAERELERESRLSSAGILSLVAIGGGAFLLINQPRLRPVIDRTVRRGQRLVQLNLERAGQGVEPVRRRAAEQLRRVDSRIEPVRRRLAVPLGHIDRRIEPVRRRAVDQLRRFDRRIEPIRNRIAVHAGHIVRRTIPLGHRTASHLRRLDRRIEPIRNRIAVHAGHIVRRTIPLGHRTASHLRRLDRRIEPIRNRIAVHAGHIVRKTIPLGHRTAGHLRRLGSRVGPGTANTVRRLRRRARDLGRRIRRRINDLRRRR